tara:strand:+ start:47 stop:547 length:501 start_codon:yes stop_codon:yes gene_type:complete
MKKKILCILLVFLFNISFLSANEKIVFVDLNYILSESVKGKKILKGLNDLTKKNEELFQLTEKKLNKKKDEIKKLQNIISETEYNNKVSQLKSEVSEYNNLKNNKLKSFENEKKNELDLFFNDLNKILNIYMKENNIDIIVEKKSIIMANKILDVSDKIINLLNRN